MKRFGKSSIPTEMVTTDPVLLEISIPAVQLIKVEIRHLSLPLDLDTFTCMTSAIIHCFPFLEHSMTEEKAAVTAKCSKSRHCELLDLDEGFCSRRMSARFPHWANCQHSMANFQYKAIL